MLDIVRYCLYKGLLSAEIWFENQVCFWKEWKWIVCYFNKI